MYNKNSQILLNQYCWLKDMQKDNGKCSVQFAEVKMHFGRKYDWMSELIFYSVETLCTIQVLKTKYL